MAAPGVAGRPGADHNTIVLEYLLKRGFTKAAAELKRELETGTGTPAPPRTVAQPDFDKRNVGKSRAGEVKKDESNWWIEGCKGMRDFVHGSLEIYRPELLPILLPIFVHSYLDLVHAGKRQAADDLLLQVAHEIDNIQPGLSTSLSALRLPAHIQSNELAQLWRTSRYVVRITRRGWSLLLGWLQGTNAGIGPNAAALGTGDGTMLEHGKEKILGIINERIRVDTIEPRQNEHIVLRSGLEAELSLAPGAPSTSTNALSEVLVELKLGPFPSDPKLLKEVDRQLRDNGETPLDLPNSAPMDLMSMDPANIMNNMDLATATNNGPVQADLPPYPASFRTVDVKREIEKVRDARLRLKLGTAAVMESGKKSAGAKDAALPSVCMFTFHDTADTLTSSTISEDSSIVAGGFSQSYIRLWNLKGERMGPIKSNFDSNKVRSVTQLHEIREKGKTESSIKLVGHSGPVYSLSFYPLQGPSAPPSHLLSSSADSTVRLWSLDTFSALVAYRGHRAPVWDVEWGPMGVYFASASRDGTARLWTTEKTAATRIFAGHLSDVNCVRFHPNSLYLATGSDDRTCRLWDVQQGVCTRVFVGQKAPVSAIAMSPDGKYLASASEDNTVSLWDLGSSRLIKSMSGHTSRINSLAFSKDTSVLVSGGSDCTVRVWDVMTSDANDLSAGMRGDAGFDGLGLPTSSEVNNFGALATKKDHDDSICHDLLATLGTKRTPIYDVRFTERNLCLATGAIALHV